MLGVGWAFFVGAAGSALRHLLAVHGLGVLLVFLRHKPDRPLGRLGRHRQIAQRLDQLAQLQTRIAAERIELGELVGELGSDSN